ncbi:MAG: retron system putative HNH endonuclease [Desulfovibrionaceae bacterium]|nr:retron system putative HNH endonuclease [Desulfovibrionaceae bacterium]
MNCFKTAGGRGFYIGHIQSRKGRAYAGLSVRQKRALHNVLLQEQGCVCCYCGAPLGMVKHGRVRQGLLRSNRPGNVRVAHPRPRDPAMDYDNICLSCAAGPGEEPHCAASQGGRALPVSPAQADCLSFFAFGTDGSIYPNPNRTAQEQEMARETIEILGLDSKGLRQKRAAILKYVHQCLLGDRGFLSRLTRRDGSSCHLPFYFAALSYYGRRKA